MGGGGAEKRTPPRKSSINSWSTASRCCTMHLWVHSLSSRSRFHPTTPGARSAPRVTRHGETLSWTPSPRGRPTLTKGPAAHYGAQPASTIVSPTSSWAGGGASQSPHHHMVAASSTGRVVRAAGFISSEPNGKALGGGGARPPPPLITATGSCNGQAREKSRWVGCAPTKREKGAGPGAQGDSRVPEDQSGNGLRQESGTLHVARQ